MISMAKSGLFGITQFLSESTHAKSFRPIADELEYRDDRVWNRHGTERASTLGHEMGLARTELRLSNPVIPGLAGLDCQALADTGALHLCIPEHVVIQL